MERKYYLFYSGLVFWILALISWSLYSSLEMAIFSILAIIAFFAKKISQQVNVMLKKRPPINTSSKKTSESKEHNLELHVENHNETIIANNVLIEGNLSITGQITVNGEIRGDILAANGSVNITRTGLLHGNITSQELTIDGTVYGECNSNTVNIHENGILNGRLKYETLSIKDGGKLSGHAEPILPNELSDKNEAMSKRDSPLNKEEINKSSNTEKSMQKK